MKAPRRARRECHASTIGNPCEGRSNEDHPALWCGSASEVYFARSAIRRSGGREDVKRPTRGDCHILLAIYPEGHRIGVNRTAKLQIPQRLSGLGIQREEIALLGAAEDESASRREQPIHSGL